jgi:methyl-accepting chemotaxis protein
MITKSIKFKLYTASLIIFLVVCALGFSSVMSLKNVNDGVKTIYNDRVVPIEQLKAISDMYAINIVDTAHKLRNGNIDWKTASENIDTARKTISENWSAYQNTYLTQEESKLANKVNDSFKPANVAIDKLKTIIESKDKDALAKFTIETLYPNIDPVTTDICELIQLQLNVAKKVVSDSKHTYQSSIYITIFVFTLVVLAVFFIVIVAVNIVKSLKLMNNRLHNLAVSGGDLTSKLEASSHSELTDMSNSINSFISSLREIISTVKITATDISDMSGQLDRSVEALSQNIETISSTTEEMSAGIEETTASTENIKAIVNNVENISDDIASKAKDAFDNAVHIKSRAEAVQKMATSAKIEATDIYHSANEHLTKAIEDSKAVENIKVLADSILSITKQTNLLSLNAAIEAARAGDSGRGFAVVAEEIRKLAEESSDSASKIQEVTHIIIDSVNLLSTNANEVMQFIESKVIKDYERLVEVSNQYSDDSTYVFDISKGLSTSTAKMHDHLLEIIKAISEISKASEESSQGAINIASKNLDILKESQIVSKMTDTSKQYSEGLLLQVEKFTV